MLLEKPQKGSKNPELMLWNQKGGKRFNARTHTNSLGRRA
jgi:hypothetical protein